MSRGGDRPSALKKIYRHRFTPAEVAQNERIWKVLCRHFFQRYIPANATVVDLGAGYCHFINQIECGKKYAVDLNPDVRAQANAEVEVVETSSMDLSRIPAVSVDVVFTSNFFEHLSTQADFLATLAEVRRILHPEGRLLILQPNLTYLGAHYWDFFDHHLPFTHHSLAEGLELAGFKVDEVVPRFLPYTTKSRLPKAPALVWLYLKLKPLWWLLGKQMFVVATKTRDVPGER